MSIFLLQAWYHFILYEANKAKYRTCLKAFILLHSCLGSAQKFNRIRLSNLVLTERSKRSFEGWIASMCVIGLPTYWSSARIVSSSVDAYSSGQAQLLLCLYCSWEVTGSVPVKDIDFKQESSNLIIIWLWPKVISSTTACRVFGLWSRGNGFEFCWVLFEFYPLGNISLNRSRVEVQHFWFFPPKIGWLLVHLRSKLT